MLLAPIRQLIESVDDTLKANSIWNRTARRTLAGVTAGGVRRLRALTAAIWHDRANAQPITRSLIGYDH